MAPLPLSGSSSSATPYEVEGFSLVQLGLSAGDSFKYFATLINPVFSERSDEFQGVAVTTPISPAPGFDPVILASGDYNTLTTFDPDGDNDGLAYALEDKDLDGLMDAGETDPNDDDTDDDGLLDGTEDADRDGIVDAAETDPLDADSDNDSLQDGLETGLTSPEGFNTVLSAFTPDGDSATTTDPLDDDTDNDTLLDGAEDADRDGRVDAGETDPNLIDTDGDGVDDSTDVDPVDLYLCSDLDADTCDDCSQGSGQDTANDGTDTDGDGECDAGDTDDDNDGVDDNIDISPTNNLYCIDVDADFCDDCSQGGGQDPNNDGADNDSDGLCDLRDGDDDNDGVIDQLDSDPLNAYVCEDADSDLCDDCSQGGGADTNNDGADTDGDGICDLSDNDGDNDGYDVPGDCDDSDPAQNPGMSEIPCDGRDNDCDGISVCYQDADMDGYRHGSLTVNSTDESCTTGSGEALSTALSDCDDADAAQNPGVSEISGDDKDNDCDGISVCYADADADADMDMDGYRHVSSTVNSTANEICTTADGEATAATQIDCDDAAAEISPVGLEICDDLDNDCDEQIDEGLDCPIPVEPTPVSSSGGGGGGCFIDQVAR